MQKVKLEGRGVSSIFQKEEEKLSEMDCDSVNNVIGLSTILDHHIGSLRRIAGSA